MTESHAITELLGRWPDDKDAPGRVMPLVYDNLRQIARGLFRHERPDHTLQPTGLINEAYLRLIKGGPFNDRQHFFRTAANAMRQVLVDYARRHRSEKRGGALERVELEDGSASVTEECAEILAMEEVLLRLEARNRRQAEFVKLRFFAGLTLEETAEILNISLSTAKEDWSKAKEFLKEQLAV